MTKKEAFVFFCLFGFAFLLASVKLLHEESIRIRQDVTIVGRAVIQLQNQELGTLREKAVDLKAQLEKNALDADAYPTVFKSEVSINPEQPEIPSEECCWGNRGYVVGAAS